MLKQGVTTLLIGISFIAISQVNVPINGPVNTNKAIHAFVNATIHTNANETILNGTLIVRGERISAIGVRIPLPANSIIHDLKGKHIWPGIVEPYATEGFAKRKKPSAAERKIGARFWNDAVHASFNAAEEFTIDEKAMAAWRKMGVTTIITHRKDGIVRGSGIAVHTGGRGTQEDIIRTNSSLHFSFNKGSSADRYPSSLMGSIALLRQTFLDAEWYSEQGVQEQSDVELEALLTKADLTWVFEANTVDDNLRIAHIAPPDRRFVIKGTGKEYLRDIPNRKETGVDPQMFIIPLNFPKAYDVSDPYDAIEVSLGDMLHWERAASNAKYLSDNDVPFAFTTDGLKKRSDLFAMIRSALQFQLDTADALEAITYTPASLFGLSEIGQLTPGAYADILISSEHLFAESNTIYETWVAGQRFVSEDMDALDLAGNFNLKLKGKSLSLSITKGKKELVGSIKKTETDTVKVLVKGSTDGKTLTLFFDGTSYGMPGSVRANAMIHNKGALLDGQAQDTDGSWFDWSAVRVSELDEKKKESKSGKALRSATFDIPFGSSGVQSGSVLIRNATVWTNSGVGILPKADVLILNGKIVQIAEKIALDEKRMEELSEVIDANGMHLTSGIIDEHTHIAISKGVNEGAQAVTAEVRIGDVLDPSNIGIYRLLAGGVTSVQLLHGSANPIGGQSALIKLRWGADAQGLKIKDASQHIKFALGENTKGSRSSSSRRFPRTRMGVEQVFYEAFHRARAYGQEWTDYRASLPKPSKRRRKRNVKQLTLPPPPRHDLELEALLEVLNGERFVTCHSYVVSEIDMLMHVADSMGFTVNTFTHILEGYKLANKLKAHGVSASTFSDWWGYKFEVNDAIPYNAALLSALGVNTGINSDDAEMGRRLNQEAAKAVKYGGMSEEEAWKMVTLNPAKMLKLDGRMGSIEVGKDGDLVLWNTNPLAIAAVPQQTYIDGYKYFDIEEDKQRQIKIIAERQRLIQLMLEEKKNGKPTQKVKPKEEHHWHCDSIGQEP